MVVAIAAKLLLGLEHAFSRLSSGMALDLSLIILDCRFLLVTSSNDIVRPDLGLYAGLAGLNCFACLQGQAGCDRVVFDSDAAPQLLPGYPSWVLDRVLLS